MSVDNPHFALGHGCVGCKLTEVLHTGCPQLGHGHIVRDSSIANRTAAKDKPMVLKGVSKRSDLIFDASESQSAGQ